MLICYHHRVRGLFQDGMTFSIIVSKLYCIVLYCIVLLQYCIILYCYSIVAYCIVTILHCIVLLHCCNILLQYCYCKSNVYNIIFFTFHESYMPLRSNVVYLQLTAWYEVECMIDTMCWCNVAFYVLNSACRIWL